MQFQVGDQVVHWTYGPGIVIEVDKKIIAGNSTDCYVVKINEMTLWVPLERAASGSLRLPTPASQFSELFEILRSPGHPLAEDRLERRNHLLEQLKGGSLASICQVIRDLHTLKRTRKMNDHDAQVLERSYKFLLNEWQVALAVTSEQAEKELRHLLGDDVPVSAGHKA